VRVGQIGADTEFFTSEAATVFYNPTFGAPAILANDLPSGGPTYPLATPAARLLLKPIRDVTLRVAVFNGDPAGPYRPGINSPNPQIRDFSGTNFRLGDPPLLVTELAIDPYRDASPAALPGTVKVGYIHHFGTFAATNTPSLPAVRYKGDDTFYAMGRSQNLPRAWRRTTERVHFPPRIRRPQRS
jgi:porin